MTKSARARRVLARRLTRRSAPGRPPPESHAGRRGGRPRPRDRRRRRSGRPGRRDRTRPGAGRRGSRRGPWPPRPRAGGRSRPPTAGCTIALRSASASGSREHEVGHRRAVERAVGAPRSPGPKRSTIARKTSVPGSWSSRVIASASITTAPRSARSVDTLDLPEPIPPVSPTSSTAAEASIGSERAVGRRGSRVASSRPICMRWTTDAPTTTTTAPPPTRRDERELVRAARDRLHLSAWSDPALGRGTTARTGGIGSSS